MLNSKLWAILNCAALSVVSGCGTTANDGAGFETLTPSSVTRTFIIKNDRPFAVQVGSHNATCLKQPGCRK